MMSVGHIAGIIGNNHGFHFATLMIINSKGNRINTNLKGTARVPRTVHGNGRSTVGGVVDMSLSRGSDMARSIVNGFKDTSMLLGGTPRNANIVTKKPTHTMVRTTKIGGVHAGSLKSGGGRGIMLTAVRNLGTIGAPRSITELHNGSVRRVLNWSARGPSRTREEWS